MTKKDETKQDEVKLEEAQAESPEVVSSNGHAQPVMSKSQVESRLKELEAKAQRLEDQLKRAVADYQNLEKRITEGRVELSKWATTELLKKLIPVLDHLDQALDGMGSEEKISGWAQGVMLAVKQFKDVLTSEGLEEIVTSSQFDPSLHEAVDTGEGEDNKILKVVRKGYRLNGKVLRPAQVVVGRRHAGEEKGES